LKLPKGGKGRHWQHKGSVSRKGERGLQKKEWNSTSWNGGAHIGPVESQPPRGARKGKDVPKLGRKKTYLSIKVSNRGRTIRAIKKEAMFRKEISPKKRMSIGPRRAPSGRSRRGKEKFKRGMWGEGKTKTKVNLMNKRGNRPPERGGKDN